MTSPTGRESAPLVRPLRRPRQGRAEGADVVATGQGVEDGAAGPRTSRAESATRDDPAPVRSVHGRDPVPVLVLLSADWAGPSRPAPTLLTELSRRWGASMRTLLLEDPDDELLDRWEIEHLPTWLRFVPESSTAVPDQEDVESAGGDGESGHRAASTDRDRADALAADARPVPALDVSTGTNDRAPAPVPAAASDTARLLEGTALRETSLSGRTPGGEEITLPGPWRLSHRRSGALPKHAVEAELGPDAR